MEPRTGDTENLGETGTAANDIISESQERANVTDNSALTPGANTDDTSQSEPLLEIPEVNTTAIAMEGEELTNTTASREKGWFADL